MFAQSSPSELPEMRTVSFESGVSCWEDLQRVSLGLMKCLEIMDSYSSDSLHAGFRITLSEDQIRTKIGNTNIALGRSMQYLLQTSFSNGHRGFNDSTFQVPIQETNITFEGLPRSEMLKGQAATARRQSVATFDSPMSIGSLDSITSRKSSAAPRSSISAASIDAASHSESNFSARRASTALPPQSSASSEDAPLPAATWEAKRSSVAPRSSISAASIDAASHSESNFSARRASTALPPQSSASSEDGSLQVANFTWEALPLQFSDSRGSPRAAFKFQSVEEEYSSDEPVVSDDIHHKNEIIASINARVASERNQQQHLGSLSWAENSEQGNHGSKGRRFLSIPGRLLEEAGYASRNQVRDSLSRSDISRHLLGGSFAQDSVTLNDRGPSRVQPRDFVLGRNVYNPSAMERPSATVSCVATFFSCAREQRMHPSYLIVAGKGIVDQCCKFLRKIRSSSQQS